jgi:Fic family protein
MEWNWQKKDWPHFTYDKEKIKDLEDRMIYGTGLLFGAFQHLSQESQDYLKIEIISNEALKTSEIEGEYLNRDSLQSSILRQFGLKSDNRKIQPAEKAISELMVDLYNNYEAKLSHALLYSWHRILMKPRSDIVDIGCYRKSDEPMQIISGPIHDPKIHFEAPPSSKLMQEMEQFIDWFNDTAPNGAHPLSCLTRASIAHLYFMAIHPFEDGNGRIGRAIAEKAIAGSIGYPSLIALATMIEKDKKAYYQALENTNESIEITHWIHYFAQVMLEAQHYTQTRMAFLIKKAKFYEQYKEFLNERQAKVISRMFDEGSNGFKGGLSAKNYLSITGTSRPTATRDLHELVIKNILVKSGDRKHARYSLKL